METEKPQDRLDSILIRQQAASTVEELRASRDRRHDQSLRERLRALICMAYETGIVLNLSARYSQLGKSMERANARSREMGWL